MRADVDEVAVYRRRLGDKSVPLNKAEQYELVSWWLRSGRPMNECERLTGLNPYRVLTNGDGS